MAGRWFSPGIPFSSTNKSDRHNIKSFLSEPQHFSAYFLFNCIKIFFFALIFDTTVSFFTVLFIIFF
jgi:hypothetical protein